MFRGANHTTEAVIELIRTLPEKEQRVIVKTLTAPKPKKKLTVKAKRKQQVLKGIATGLREVKQAKRTGKQLPDLQDLLHELKGKG